MALTLATLEGWEIGTYGGLTAYRYDDGTTELVAVPEDGGYSLFLDGEFYDSGDDVAWVLDTCRPLVVCV